MKLKKHNFLLIILLLLGLFGLTLCFAMSKPEEISGNEWLDKKIELIKGNTNIDTKVLRLALTAYQKAKVIGVATKPILTVIDYSKPSTEKRLWVFDIASGKTLFNTWVSHGKNSGNNRATSFSNRFRSLKSSIGVFLTDQPYIGKHGYSLHIRGLEQGINDNAYERAIVIHGANYVNSDIIKSNGRLGRSWGCPAVSTYLSTPLINRIKNKTLLFAYYPDTGWLKHSRFLTGKILS